MDKRSLEVRKLQRANCFALLIMLAVTGGLGWYAFGRYQHSHRYEATVPPHMTALIRQTNAEIERIAPSDNERTIGVSKDAAAICFEDEAPITFSATVQAVKDKGMLSWDKTRVVRAELRGAILLSEQVARQTFDSSLELRIGQALEAAMTAKFDQYDEKDFGEAVVSDAQDALTAQTGLHFSELAVTSHESGTEKDKRKYAKVVLDAQLIRTLEINPVLDTELMTQTAIVAGSVWFGTLLACYIVRFPVFVLAALSAVIIPYSTRQVRRRVQEGGDPCPVCDLACIDCCGPGLPDMPDAPDINIDLQVGPAEVSGCLPDCAGVDCVPDCGSGPDCVPDCGGCGDCGGCDGCGDCGGCDCGC